MRKWMQAVHALQALGGEADRADFAPPGRCLGLERARLLGMVECIDPRRNSRWRITELGQDFCAGKTVEIRERPAGNAPSRMTGLTRKLRAFYEANPGEDFTQQQIAVKFNARPGTVRSAVYTLTRQGFLRREAVYRLDRGAD